MRNHQRLAAAIGTFMVAAMALGACAPATGTPALATAAQISTAAPALATGSPPSAAPAQVTDTPAAPAVSPAVVFKSKDPTTLIYVRPGDVRSLDPAWEYETAGGSVILNTYDTLVFYNKDDPNSFVPQLATEVPSQTNGGISADGKTYTFKIRTGVKFHNGDQLTPGDVAFTFQRGLLQGGSFSGQFLLFQPILGLAASPSGNNDITDLVDPSGQLLDDRAHLVMTDTAKLLAACQTVVGAIVADDAANTVTFHLAQPWGPFLLTLAGTWGSITDKKWIGANGGWDGDCHTWQNFYAPATTDAKDLNQLGIGSRENGTGPYRLDHWTPNQEVVLKAFDGYWRTAPAWPGGPTGAPRLKTIVIKSELQFVTRLAAMQAGTADVILLDSTANWPQMDVLVGEICDKDGHCHPSPQPSNPLRVYTGLPDIVRSDASFNFQINVADGNDFVGSGKLDGNGIPPDFFGDVHVRKAFSDCFDWAAYIRDALQGEGTQAIDVMLPGELGYSDQDPRYLYDPARCKAEFLASSLKSADGKSLWNTGFKLTMPYVPGNKLRQAAAQILSQDISAVNPKFVIQVTALPQAAFNAVQSDQKLPIRLVGWLEDIHDSDNWLVPYGTGAFAQWQSLPDGLLKTFGDFISRGVVETDPAKRAVIYHQFNQAFYDAAPDILLAIQSQRRYEQRWVQGYYYNSGIVSYYFYDLSKQ